MHFEVLEDRDLLAANFVMFDDDMNLGEYNKFVIGTGNGGNVTEVQKPAGGNPDSYLEITTNPNGRPGGPGTSSRVYGVYLNQTNLYRPSEHGAIREIDYSEHWKFFSSTGISLPHNGQPVRPALMQDNMIFLGPQTAFPGTSGQTPWTQVAFADLDADDFVFLDMNGVLDSNVHPNFSESGLDIRFGFCRLNSATSTTAYTITAGIDNWRVEVTSVPALFIESVSHNSFIASDEIEIVAQTQGAVTGTPVYWIVFARDAAEFVDGFPFLVETLTDSDGEVRFSFRPSDNPQLVANRHNVWTRGSRSPNMPISFDVQAVSEFNNETVMENLSETHFGFLTQDEIDRLRQEYYDYDLPIPTRGQVVPSLGAAYNRGNYGVQLSDGLDTRYNAIAADYRNQEVVVTIEGAQYFTTIPWNAPILVSGYANPQRNKAEGSTNPGNYHSRGQALDLFPGATLTKLTIHGVPRRVYLPLHQTLYPALHAAAQGYGTAYAYWNESPVPVGDVRENRIHVQWESAEPEGNLEQAAALPTDPRQVALEQVTTTTKGFHNVHPVIVADQNNGDAAPANVDDNDALLEEHVRRKRASQKF